jgi:hypothetical protein
MYTNKTSIALAIVAIVMAIALITSGSLNTSVLAAKTKKSKSSSTTGTTATSSTGSTTGSSTKASLSKFISCLRTSASSTTTIGATTTTTSKVPGKLSRAAVTSCYDTVYGARSTSSGSSSIASSNTGGGTSPQIGTP